ncbi:MAG TPA: hypothetical protein VFC78_03255 [Tepidisphaeraceae bacterium]|nr:hypothetical protein [Tepidisphaeraceae bacterium]
MPNAGENPKSEARNPKQIQMKKAEISKKRRIYCGTGGSPVMFELRITGGPPVPLDFQIALVSHSDLI